MTSMSPLGTFMVALVASVRKAAEHDRNCNTTTRRC